MCVDALALAGTSKARVYERLTSRLEHMGAYPQSQPAQAAAHVHAQWARATGQRAAHPADQGR